MIPMLGKAGVVLAVVAVAVAGCGATVRPGQRGIKYRALSTPGLQKKVNPEGFYWLWPWNRMITYDVTWQSQSERLDILTADDLHVATELTVTLRPDKARIYELHTEIGPDYYGEIVRPAFLSIARAEFALHRHNDLAREEPEIERAILARLTAAIGGRPIEVSQVAVKHVEYDRNVAAAISAKLATGQRVEQKEAEVRIAERDAEIQRTTAKGRSDAIRLEAEGQAAAIVLKGEAQAKAQTAVGRTLTADYLRYKAFDGDATRYYFVPVGKDGMPLIVDTHEPRR